MYLQTSMNRLLSVAEHPEHIISLLQGSNDMFLRLLDSVPPLRFIVQALLEAGNPLYVLILLMLVLLFLLLMLYFPFGERRLGLLEV